MSDAGSVVAGLGVVFIAIVGLARYLLSDRSVAATHTKQIADLKAELAAMRVEMAMLRNEVAEQHHLKHVAIGKQSAAEGTLDLVRSLYDQCTCGALLPLARLLDRRSDHEGDT